MTSGGRSKILRFAMAVFLASTGLAAAAGDLTREDLGYLSSTYGLGPQGDVLAGLSPAEQSSLHAVISGLKSDPPQRDDAVRDRLYRAYARECDAWARSHRGEACVPAKDAAARPGKEIADRYCNGCHLFGSGVAPSFFRLAQQRQWDADAVGGALRHTHDMVPVNLPDDEQQRLAVYINSFR